MKLSLNEFEIVLYPSLSKIETKLNWLQTLEQTWPTRRVLTLEWSRQAFEVLLIGSGDGSSRISASACERWQRGVSYTTTGLSHDPRTLVVLGCRGGGSDRPQTAAEKRGALGYVFEKNRPRS